MTTHIKDISIPLEGGKIIIEAEVSPNPYYENVRITKVVIYDANKFVDDTNPGTVLYTKELDIPSMDIYLEVSEMELLDGEIHPSVATGLFVVKIETNGLVTPSCPCNLAKDSMRLVFSRCSIYNTFLNLSKEMLANGGCRIPMNLVDFMLRYKAVKYASETGNILKAVELYNKFFVNSKIKLPPSRGCGCNG